MKSELKGALERIGWDALYEQHIAELAPVNAKGERRCLSPFPDTIDRQPSFTVNVQNGLWRCFKTDRGGDFVKFWGIMHATHFDPTTGMAIEDYAEAERNLMREVGLSRPIKPEWVDECRDVLYGDLAIRETITRVKPWHANVLYSLKIGYSVTDHKIVIPAYNRNGELVNCRMYRPGGVPKFVWHEMNSGGNFLFPHAAWREASVILVEGEPDAISLRSIGFPGCSGTLGAGQPVPDGEWWRGKIVYVWMDDDQKGQEAEREAVRRMADLAKELRVVRLPHWPGRPEKPDASDYTQYLQSVLGYELEQVQRAITQLLCEAETVDTTSSFLDQEAVEASFRQALNSQHLNKRIKFVGRITAKSPTKFVLPLSYGVVCPAEGHAYCKRCTMQSQFHGNARFVHDPRSRETLKLVQTSEEKQLETIKELQGIIKQCNEPRMTTVTAVDVEAVILNASVVSGVGDMETSERQRREAYVIVPPGAHLEDNRDYLFTGFVYAHPKTQQAVFLLDSFEPYGSRFDSFVATPEDINRLRSFCPAPGEAVIDKLRHVATDLMESVTMIVGRLDLHLAYRTVWHSSLAFPFMGKTMHRGWIEALVLGDTRCGKSEAFRQLSDYYGLGMLIDCKMQSVPGILGTVVQSASGEYYVVAGLLPQQDGRVVCFDEFTVPRGQGQSIIEILSSTRSEGIVRISKAASAEFRARVRSIWLANPGTGRLIAQCSDSGVELINRLIPQPEDIARFDLALTVSQGDVPAEVINTVRHPAPPKYERDLARALLAWTYSRRPDQVVFDQKAEAAVVDLAIRMHKRYDPSIPLVEISDQRNRVAKLAVSVAAQVFSTDALADKIIVMPEHVQAVEQLYTIWYDKPVMGYAQYSSRMRNDDQLLSEEEVKQLFDITVSPHGKRLAEELLRLDEITEKTLGTIVPVAGLFTRSVLQVLYLNRAIHLVQRGKRESYEKTPAFTSFLKRYLT